MQWQNSKETWGWLTVIIHWLTVMAVLGLFSVGFWMVDLGYYHTWYYKAPLIHKSVGILLLGLTLFRVLWRLFSPAPRPLATHSPFEKMAAKMVHLLLYLLLLGTMVSGYLIATAAGKPILVFGWIEFPAIVKGFKGQADIAGDVHKIVAFILMGLVLLHALAALKHHFVDKDDTLNRMVGRKKAQ